jgi:hypothetical protein
LNVASQSNVSAERRTHPGAAERDSASAPSPRVVQSLQRGLQVLAYVVEAERPLKLLGIVQKIRAG